MRYEVLRNDLLPEKGKNVQRKKSILLYEQYLLSWLINIKLFYLHEKNEKKIVLSLFFNLLKYEKESRNFYFIEGHLYKWNVNVRLYLILTRIFLYINYEFRFRHKLLKNFRILSCYVSLEGNLTTLLYYACPVPPFPKLWTILKYLVSIFMYFLV